MSSSESILFDILFHIFKYVYHFLAVNRILYLVEHIYSESTDACSGMEILDFHVRNG